jgi:hypothetical protein
MRKLVSRVLGIALTAPTLVVAQGCTVEMGPGGFKAHAETPESIVFNSRESDRN